MDQPKPAQVSPTAENGDGRPPRVSVVMPLLNPHPIYFPQAVESILGQTFRDLELIIVEDPSEQSGKHLLQRYADSRIRHEVNLKRTSLAQQRNRTLALARGDFVAFLDADDVAEPDRIEKQYRFLLENRNVDVLGTNLRIIDPQGRPRGYRLYPTNHDAIASAMPKYNPMGQPSMMCRKAVVLDAGGFHLDWCLALDYDLWCRLAKNGARFANLPEPLVQYRIHPEGSKSAQLRRTLLETLQIKEKHWGSRMGRSARFRAACERLFLHLPAGLVLRLFMLWQYRKQPPRSVARPVLPALTVQS